MGSNGSLATGATRSDAGRDWKTVTVIDDVQVIQKKNIKSSNKLPEESATPNRIYALFEKDGSDVKGVAKYGEDGKKIWEIHTADHDGMGEHYHSWINGHPERCWDESKKKYRNVAHSLTPSMKSLLEKIRRYGN